MSALPWLLRAVGLLPAVVFALEWLSVPVPYVRLSRPALAIPLSMLLLWLTLRLSRFAARRTRARALAMTWFTGAAATACAFAVIGVELGRKLDRLTIIVQSIAVVASISCRAPSRASSKSCNSPSKACARAIASAAWLLPPKPWSSPRCASGDSPRPRSALCSPATAPISERRFAAA